MPFELQPSLESQQISLRPLRSADFEALYAVASDPLIWEQHPSRERYQREVFANYFKGAMESGGALLIRDARSDVILGSSRYYDRDEDARRIAIGYTFIARSHWGRGYNRALKTLMLDHAFRFVDCVVFHVGANNLRSRMAMQKLGATLTGEAAISYYGEPSNLNVIYEMQHSDWLRLRSGPVP
ncbi:MAG TPA: GNAT family N-acetyltransferase [Steroidobacteraceae bacterium]|jgi:RimJ/RimL family protein N-acetyltransferase